MAYQFLWLAFFWGGGGHTEYQIEIFFGSVGYEMTYYGQIVKYRCYRAQCGVGGGGWGVFSFVEIWYEHEVLKKHFWVCVTRNAYFASV